MRRLLLVVALLPLVAAPVLAGPYNSIPKGLPPTDMSTTGVYAPPPAGPGIYMDMHVPGYESDIMQFTFAFHWPYITSNALGQLQFDLRYDNTEVQIIGIQPAPTGPFAGGVNGFATATWPDPGTGDIVATLGLWCNPASPGFMMTGSGIYPIFVVTAHVKADPHFDTQMDIVMSSCNLLLSHIATGSYPPYTSYWWSASVGDVNYGVDIPEPSTIGLAVCGLLAVSGGIWRRRR